MKVESSRGGFLQKVTKLRKTGWAKWNRQEQEDRNAEIKCRTKETKVTEKVSPHHRGGGTGMAQMYADRKGGQGALSVERGSVERGEASRTFENLP